MIEIAVCDDEKDVLEGIKKKILQYGEKTGLELSVDVFCNAAELGAEIGKNKRYQIYFLDMMMPQMDGIEIGQAIRRSDRQAVIICVTSSKDFAYRAFGIYAQRYLLKPLERSAFCEAMDFAVGRANDAGRQMFVKTSDGMRGILHRDVEYVENAGRMLHIYTTEGKEIVSRILRNSFEKSLKALLEDEDFIQVHKSFLVNLSCVDTYGQSQVVMRSGREIPVSKSRQAAVRSAYFKYVSERY